MIPCPSCLQPIEILDKHLGALFTCPHCSAVYFISLSGLPEVETPEDTQSSTSESSLHTNTRTHTSTNIDGEKSFSKEFPDFVWAANESKPDEELPPPENSVVTETFSHDSAIIKTDQSQFSENNSAVSNESQTISEHTAKDMRSNSWEDQSPPSPEVDQEPVQDLSPVAEAPLDVPEVLEEQAWESPVSINESLAEQTESVEEIQPFDFEQTLDQMPITPEEHLDTSDSPDFSDIEKFANAEVDFGPLAYSVFIEGIDSSQTIHLFKEAVTDSRFNWDTQNLLGQIKSGRLVLKGLSPAAASVLVNRLKYLPLKITWRQDVLTNS